MSFDFSFCVFAVMVALAFTTEAATGFGSMVIAMTLGAHLYDMHSLQPLLVTLNVVLTSYLVTRHHDHIEGKLLLTRVLPLMGVGMVGGLFAFQYLSDQTLRLLFGIFVVVVSLRELSVLLGKAAEPRAAFAPVAATTGMVGAGVIHGIYATGGPLLVYILGRLGMNKASFRSTLATVWLTLNFSLAVTHFAAGRLNAETLPFIGALIPVVLLSIVIGEWAHTRLDEHRFRIAVFSLLLLSGASLLV